MQRISTLLKEYLNELKRDEQFITILRNAGLNSTVQKRSRIDAEALADDWIDTVEIEIGSELAPGHRSQIVRFIEQRLPGLVVKFHGDDNAARWTMYNILNSKFNDLKRPQR